MKLMLKTTSLAIATVLCTWAGSSFAATFPATTYYDSVLGTKSSFGFSNLTGAEYDTAGVFVKGDITFTGTTDDTGTGFDQVEFKLWDDGAVMFDQIYQAAVGATQTFSFSTWYAGLVGTSAPGVGLYLYDLPGGVATYIDPYYVPHYKDPSQCTVDCGPVPGVPEPSTYALMLAGLGAVGFAARRRKG